METNTSLPSNDQLNEHPDYSGLTGIPLVDEQLTKATPNGGVIIVTAPTGAGKSVLAGQIAARCAMACRHVSLVSTEMETEEYEPRMLSCLTEWSYQQLRHGVTIEPLAGSVRHLALDSRGTPEFTAKAATPINRLLEYVDMMYVPEFKKQPLIVLHDVLACVAGDVECLILDYLVLDLPELADPGNRGTIPMLAKEVMQLLRQFSNERGIPVFVFCQARVDDRLIMAKVIDRSFIAEFPSIADGRDCFIGISQRVFQGNEASDTEATYSPHQYFTLQINNGKLRRIPVKADFDYQRFVARVEDNRTKDQALREKGREIAIRSRHRGFTWFRRDDFRKTCELGYSAPNVYAMALLVAQFEDGPRQGTFFHSVTKFAKLLGLTSKQVRLALYSLEKAKLVERTGKRIGRSIVRKVVNYGKDKDTEKQSSFKIAQNLRDEDQKELVTNPLRFRVWLALLYKARMTEDPLGLLEPGELKLDYNSLAELLQEDHDDIVEVIVWFRDQGMVEFTTMPHYGDQLLRVVNYEVYQGIWIWGRTGQ